MGSDKRKIKETEQERIAKLKKLFLEYYKDLPIQNLACGYIGRTEDTISIWKREDPEFSDLVTKAKSDWVMRNVKAVKSRTWLLERVTRDFTPRQEITGKDGKDLPIPILKVVTDVPRDDSDKKDTETN